MELSRRRLLSTLGALSASVAGCVARPPGVERGSGLPEERTSTTGTEAPTSTASLTTTEPTESETTMDDGNYRLARATGEPTSIEREIEADEGYEYLPETDEIRYVAAYRRTNPDEVENGSKPEREPVYDTIPFERWARTECLGTGAKGVNKALGERLDGKMRGIGTGVGRIDGEPKRRISVWVETLLNRDGDVIMIPAAEFEDVVAMTPETVEVTFTFSGKERSCTEPVFVQKVTIQEE